MAFQKQLRVRNAKNGFICSTGPYKEEIFQNLEDVLRYIRRYFSEENYQKRNDYKKDE